MQNKICKKAIEKFGKDKQLDMAIEEMSELIKAIVKYRRYNWNKVWELKMIDEMVDVEIMLEQLKQMLTNRDEFELQKLQKLKRLETIINETDSPYRGLRGEDVARGFGKEE